MPFELPIERGKIREFARATFSSSPDLDGDHPVVPPTFLTTARLNWEPASENVLPQLGFDLRRVLHAEEEYQFTGALPRAGDQLSAAVEVVERYEKEGRRGGLLRFAVIRTRFTNSAGNVVAEQRTTLVETAQATKEPA